MLDSRQQRLCLSKASNECEPDRGKEIKLLTCCGSSCQSSILFSMDAFVASIMNELDSTRTQKRSVSGKGSLPTAYPEWFEFNVGRSMNDDLDESRLVSHAFGIRWRYLWHPSNVHAIQRPQSRRRGQESRKRERERRKMHCVD